MHRWHFFPRKEFESKYFEPGFELFEIVHCIELKDNIWIHTEFDDYLRALMNCFETAQVFINPKLSITAYQVYLWRHLTVFLWRCIVHSTCPLLSISPEKNQRWYYLINHKQVWDWIDQCKLSVERTSFRSYLKPIDLVSYMVELVGPKSNDRAITRSLTVHIFVTCYAMSMHLGIDHFG